MALGTGGRALSAWEGLLLGHSLGDLIVFSSHSGSHESGKSETAENGPRVCGGLEGRLRWGAGVEGLVRMLVNI